MAYGGNHLYYAHFDGIEWQYETVDKSSDVGEYASIAIASNNKVHISYYDSTNGDLKYATNVSGAWVTSTIDSGPAWVGYCTSIAIDSNNDVHISYYDYTNVDLKYATNVSGAWVTSTIDSEGSVGWDTSIAIDSNNKVHISYRDITYDDLKYATNASGAWVTSTIDSEVNMVWYTSIAIDSNNKVHISYYDSTNRDLRYATNASGAWVTSTIDGAVYDADYRGQFPSMAIDSNNKVHISYNRVLGAANGDLKYATNVSGAWVTSTIFDSNGIGEDVRDTSIAIDSNNKVHISYHQRDNINDREEIKYVTDASGAWVISTIDSEGSVGLYTSIAIDSNNKVHISYYASLSYDLKYATDASGAWVTSTIDSEGSVGWDTSIAIDSNNKVHISYHDNTNSDLKYATNASGAWVTSTIDSEGSVGWDTSIAIDSNNKVHISYHDNTNYDLKYATNVSGAWVTSTIHGGEAWVGYDTSIAIDSNNKVHISYYDSTNYDLKYATDVSGAWVISTIDMGYVDGRTSIAIDSNNKVHISYCYRIDYGSYFSYSLNYATNASGAWVTSTIGSEEYVGWDNSIAIDSNNNVHISYYDSVNGYLNYATNTSGTWVIFTVGQGRYTSIAIDSNNKVHISYYDTALKYATNSVPTPDISVSPVSFDFGNVNVGITSAPQTLTVSHTGLADLVIGTLSITGTDAPEFSIQNDNCSGQTIAPSGTCTVDVAFSPTSLGLKSANLSVPSNDPGIPILNVPLSGISAVKGDINGDGVDLSDAILALQVLAGLNPDGIHLSGDVNGDDNIGLADAIYILQKVSGMR